MNEHHRVLIVDDHPLFRKGVGQLLQMVPGFVLAGEAADGEEGLALSRQLKPDLILLDLNMRGMNGLEVLRGLRTARIESKVVMITVSDAGEDVVAALRAGVDGYLLKDMEPEDIIKDIHKILRDELVISPSLAPILAQAMRKPAKSADNFDLTEREQQVLQMIAEGLSNKMIGNKLGIAESTVKVHVKHILGKVGLRTRVEAAVWAVQQHQK